MNKKIIIVKKFATIMSKVNQNKFVLWYLPRKS